MSECLVKAAHIVLATRLSALGSAAPKASTRDKTNRWFNLETEEVESATPALERWKRDASSPLVMEIFGRKLQQADGASSSSGGSSVLDPGNLLEVWTLQIGRKKPQGGAFGMAPSDHSASSSATSSGSNSSQQARLTRVNSSRMDIPLVYKRAVILLRSLFCFVRVLPCFSIFQVTKRSSTSKLSITSNMRTGPPKTQPPSFDGIPCRSHAFKPIETPLGSICISVSYATAPVEALTRELGSGIVGDARRSAAGIGVGSAAGAGAGACSLSASSRGASPHATTPAGIPVPSGGATHAHASPAAYSAPQVVRRKSWSYSRNQIQQQEASRRFTDVMVVDSVQEEGSSLSGGGGGLTRKNSSPMSIPNAFGRRATPTWSTNSSYSGNSSSNFSQGHSRERKMTISFPEDRLGGPGRVAKGPASASPKACVVGFAAVHQTSGDHLPLNAANIPKLPTSALGTSSLGSSSTYKSPLPLPVSAGNSSIRSVEGSEATTTSSYKFALSCSPQLPFAFTPRLNSASSMSYDFQTSPMNSAGGFPSIRLVRRSSMSPKDSSDMAAFMQSTSGSPSSSKDAFFYGDLALPYASPTPYGPSPGMGTGMGIGVMPHGSHGSFNQRHAHARLSLGFPNSHSGTYEDHDEDALPFALETHSPGEASGMKGHGAEADDAAEDAAVGAFVRVLQDAPPLRTGRDAGAGEGAGGKAACRTLSSALLELKQMRESLDTARLVFEEPPLTAA